MRTQVLRLPGTLHQNDPANPHLVRIVEELSSWQVYSAAEIAAAFPPRPISKARRLRRSSARAPGSDWEPQKILSAFVAIDGRLKGERTIYRPRRKEHGDKPIKVDWSVYDWWFRGTAAIHHASGGSDAGFELSCQVSGGGGSKGLIGCPEKFNEAGQRRLWESLSNDGFRIRSDAVTIDTIYWIAGRYCGWKRGRHGRPLGQPREIKLSEQAEAVADAGRRAVSAGLDRVRELHADVCAPLFPRRSPVGPRSGSNLRSPRT